MADVKITGLTPKSADMETTDLLEATVDPSGSPLSRSITGAELLAMVVAETSGVTLQAFNTNLTAINQALTTTSNVNFGNCDLSGTLSVGDDVTIGQGRLHIKDTANQLRLFDTDGTDPLDNIRFNYNVGIFILRTFDDSSSTENNILQSDLGGDTRLYGNGILAVTLSGADSTFDGDLTVNSSNEVFLNLPTSAGTTGSLWSDSGTVKVA